MKKKKILFYHPHFGDGGAEKTNLSLSENFSKKYKIIFVSNYFSKKFNSDIQRIGIKKIKLSASRTIFSFYELKRLFERLKPDLIFSIQMHAGITVLILNKLFFKNKLKIICSERVSKESYGNGIKGKSIILLARLFYKNAKKIICNSMELAEEFKKISKNKNVTYIYNPTLKINHKKLSKKINIIEKPFIKKNKPIIISIGRLDDNKNQMMILKALNCIKKKINYNLVLIGEGKNKKKLLDYASKNNILKNLFIYNFKKNPFPYLQKSDLFISTSNYEGLPNVLIEAMALNIPIISTNAPAGPREILLNGRAGFLIKRNDFIDLSKKIELFFQSPKIFKLKKKFYKKSLRRFVPKNSFKKYNQIINNLLYSQY